MTARATQALKVLGGKDIHPTLDLGNFSGFEILASGNVIIANWLGHLATPPSEAPHIVEFDQNNKAVWTWGNQAVARQITNILVIR